MNSNFLTKIAGYPLYLDQQSDLRGQERHLDFLLSNRLGVLQIGQAYSRYTRLKRGAFFEASDCPEFQKHFLKDTGSCYHNYYPYHWNTARGMRKHLNDDFSCTSRGRPAGGQPSQKLGSKWACSAGCCSCLISFRPHCLRSQKQMGSLWVLIN